MGDISDVNEQAWLLLELTHKFARGQRNLVDFRREFFPSRGDVKEADFHHEWSDILLHGEKHAAFEAFRESAKTTYVMRTFPEYCLVYPSYELDFVVLVSADEDIAHDKLASIKADYKSHPYLSSNLVEIVEDNEDAFEVLVKPYGGGEPINVRIAVFGKGSQIRGLESRGRRPKIVILDDVQDKKAIESDLILRKDLKWFLGDVMFLGENCRIFMIGNNLGEKCLIEYVFSNADDVDFECRRVPALDQETESVSAWPDKLPAEKLIKERTKYQNMGQLDVWYRERMCKAVSPDDQRFKRDMFRYYDHKNLPKHMNVYTTVDLAISQNRRSDFTAVCTVGVTSENHWFVLDIDYGRWKPDEIMNAIFRAASKWKPIEVGWEKVAFQAVIGHLIEKEMPARDIFFRSKGLIAERRKELRIEMLAPRFSMGTVWFPKGAGFLTELEGELLKFPTGLHDDLIDALAYVEQLALVPGDWDTGDDDDIPLAGGM
ncbi:phage terminase large subunit [Cloacibacillus evryensis]|uniref:phage terminase large subunit n=1 Tax=Cloacibacillus evryensis TaxID=508460 RepID=UPI002B1F8D06|nr:phage terminase large subunit [Cloacibacillus evryensis]MEA5034229.1 phage terminase large subunit [Cloacibacillus evryensis]